MAEELPQNNFFDTEHLKADLKGRSVRGGAVTIGAQWTKFCLQTASTVVLARLLTPQDFGLIAMVMVITGFVERFKDMGLSAATVQKAEISHDQISTLFWINVAISFVIMLIAAALAPAITWFYGEPKLTWITIALACGIIFGGLTVQHQALLRRQMRFGTLAVIDIVSIAAGVLAGIIAACYGLRYWALVIMHLANPIMRVAVTWIICPWRPGMPVRRSGVREMLAFGGHLTGFNLLNYFARNADNLLIGKFWGAGQLGLYSKAYGLLMLPIGQITAPISAVAVPTLSRLQDDPERYRRYYYRAISTIAFITMPLVAMLAALSHEVIMIVLGHQWVGASPIFKVLAFAAIVQPVVGTVGWVYVSLGRTKRMMYWSFIAVPLIVLSFAIGLPWGALGVAIAYTVCILTVNTVPCLAYAFRDSPITVVDFFKAISYPAATAVVMYCVLEFMRFHLGAQSAGWILLWCFTAAGGIFLASILLSGQVRGDLAGLLAELKRTKKDI
ncbi:MAG: lipopolysaccharide biosynthesis protein [Planctomycetota bacterium]